ncbi:tRNA pseudouridine(13) synthase TruD [Colwelliaceae bacterium BS250]
MSTEQLELPYLYSKPESYGDLRSKVEDFKVFERLPFEPCGEGEHLLIHIRKTGANTLFVARQLAKYFKVKEALVSYAGLKDRNAITEQYFGVHVPGKTEYDLSDLVIEGVEVLSYKRHNKKLKTGALTGNSFQLTLRNVTNISSLTKRFKQVIEQGVPNYFGEQRFGIDGQNIDAARELFNGKKVKDKKKRGFYLSAARSHLFNAIVAERIVLKKFLTPIPGDVYMLAGSRSVFHTDIIDDEIERRLSEKDIDITAPLWGAGESLTTDKALTLEESVANQYEDLAKGLGKFGLKQERRKICLQVSEAKLEQIIEDKQHTSVVISFFLPAGCFATTILRELINYQDMSHAAHQTQS